MSNGNFNDNGCGNERVGVVYRVITFLIPPALRLRLKNLGDSANRPEVPPSTDYSSRNVMIGMLRNKRQLNKNLRGNFYHVPAKLLKNTENDIKTVALYQSKTLFGGIGGIRYFGEVESLKAVKRSEIKEIPSASGETYIYFKIKKWELLKHTVKAKECRSPLWFTTEYLLKTSESTSELFFRSEREHNLYRLLKELKEKDAPDEVSAEGVTVKIENDTFIFTRGGAFLTSVTFEDFSSRPYETTHEIFGYIG